MTNLKDLGYKDYLYLDNARIWNQKKRRYEPEIRPYTYRLETIEGKKIYTSIRWLYKKLFNEVFCVDEIQDLPEEEWRVIPETDNYYYVSNKGRIKSLKGNEAIIMRTTLTKPKGYEQVQLAYKWGKQNKLVHVLVASAFLEAPKSLDMEIHHISFNKLDNSAENLTYVSMLEHRRLHNNERRKHDNLS